MWEERIRVKRAEIEDDKRELLERRRRLEEPATLLDLSCQSLTTVSLSLDAVRAQSIITLNLRGNRLTTLRPLSLPSLRVLDVSENFLERLPPRLEVVVLVANSNRLVRLSLEAPCLERLDVSHNKLRFISPLKAPLQELDVRFNFLDDVTNVKNLKLKCLLVSGNPLVSDPRHKLKLVAVAPHLRDALGAPRLPPFDFEAERRRAE